MVAPPLVQSGLSSIQTQSTLPVVWTHPSPVAKSPLVWATPTTCLTQVSRQWGVGSRQRGRSAGQDEAFPVTRAAAVEKGRQGGRARPQPREFVNTISLPPISDTRLSPIRVF